MLSVLKGSFAKGRMWNGICYESFPEYQVSFELANVVLNVST